MDAEVAFTAVDPSQRVASVVESQKFNSSAFPSRKQSLVGLGQPQELINGIEVPQHIIEHDLHLLPCPDAGTGIHGGSGT
jgi:hypothetical protein